MGKKVLITGGAGYLGSVITGHLLNSGYEVTCLDNLSYHQNSLLHYANNPDFNFIYGDVRNRELLKRIIPEFDVIIPLAAIVGMPACDLKPEDAKTINLDAIKLINEIRNPRQKLIYPTTNSGYGTKCDAERHLLESEKDAITLRLATVFGISPRMRTDLLVNDFVLKAVQDGYIVIYQKDFKRNYIHIKDVARVFEFCINNFESMKNKAYNVGLEDANISKAELAEKIKKYIPKFEIVYKEVGEDPDKRNYIVSNQRILKTGFTPKFSIDDGIKELIKGYSIILK